MLKLLGIAAKSPLLWSAVAAGAAATAAIVFAGGATLYKLGGTATDYLWEKAVTTVTTERTAAKHEVDLFVKDLNRSLADAERRIDETYPSGGAQ